ncbi:MAG TPA: hypothetical protein VN783_03035 [Thermoanaerobaculia bacterium]|nr:hypothetical protein [Thermoanaerobaculia bacterium]
MIEARRKGFFSKDYVIEADGLEPLVLAVERWREAAIFEIDGVVYSFRRENLIGGTYLLERLGEVLLRAEKPSFFHSSFDLEIDHQWVRLRRGSLFGLSFRVTAADQEIGRVDRNFFSSRIRADLPEDWPLPTRVFVLWLALLSFRRQRREAGVSAAEVALPKG